MKFVVNLPEEHEPGVFADFASIWHTPNTFVLDFQAVVQPNVTTDGVMQSRIVARVRIPSEQIYPMIGALQEQANQWLAETGRTEPPESWQPFG